jgi:hypothetical protein
LQNGGAKTREEVKRFSLTVKKFQQSAFLLFYADLWSGLLRHFPDVLGWSLSNIKGRGESIESFGVCGRRQL